MGDRTDSRQGSIDAEAGPARPAAALVVRGARTHNLKGVDLTLPHRQLIVITGVSGSGKSSLAFDTIYAEGQRRYVESLSAYARQFLERMEKPDVDGIDGIAPAIAIRQKSTTRNPRSTVGTTTEIHDYLRLLWARIGRTICPDCDRQVERESPESVAETLLAKPPGTRLYVAFDVAVTTPPATGKRVSEEGEAGGTDEASWPDEADQSAGLPFDARLDPVRAALDGLRRRGFGRIVVGGAVVPIEEALANPPQMERAVLTVLVDRLRVGDDVRSRLTDAVETAFREGDGAALVIEVGDGGAFGRSQRFSERFECRGCGRSFETPEPRLFSFNNPFGACGVCHGFGNVIELDPALVVPDGSKSIGAGAIEPWTKPHYRSALADLKRAARVRGVSFDEPWQDLPEADRQWVLEGDRNYEGVAGFFRQLEKKKYKVHVRVFLSRYRSYQTCRACDGTRLRADARVVRVGGRTIDAASALTVADAERFFGSLALDEREHAIAGKVLAEIGRRLGFLIDVGLDYVTLDRLSSTLSGGEAQRINLATSLGSALVDTLYVLDEPSIGLHARDNERLIGILKQLRDQGNTVLVVEHDADMIRVADTIVDLGLGAGEHGGRVIYAGPVTGLLADPRSLTAKYLRDEAAIPVPATRRRLTARRIRVTGARANNLKGLDVEVPLGVFTCVTGVSGSGKSTLVHDVLYAALKRAKGDWDKPVGLHETFEGAEAVTDVVLVDQQPIGRSPRSNPVTYLKAFDPIRELFAATKDARTSGLTASHFSFNVPGGRCETCEGEGVVRVEMQFLADVFVPCDQCEGKRFKPRVLEVRYRTKNIDQVLGMTVHEALAFFAGAQKVTRRLQVLDDVGLGYLRLGQPATTLSGGEAQRIKIASHLISQGGERMLYVLDEPTTGLHFDDIAKLLAAFRKLLLAGHTLLVIEHNLDVIKTADWVLDLGPEGGGRGGQLVAVGTPEQIATVDASHTGRYLRTVLPSADARTAADPA